MKVRVIKFQEEMPVNSGLITASDPCYNNTVNCVAKNIEAKPGNYAGFAHIATISRDWGKRVITLQIVHKDYLSDLSITNCDFESGEWQHVGDAAVDAGLMSLFESGKKKDYEQNEWMDFCDKIQNKDYLFIDGMFVSSSGIGDGYYPVYALKRDGQVISVAVDFLDHPWLR